MSFPIKTVRTIADLRDQVAGWRDGGSSVALVPTMGALHLGHLSLLELARSRAQRVVVSIFVNPTQFAANEDFGNYPREESRDTGKIASVGADLIFAPAAEEMYPTGFGTRIEVSGVSAELEGVSRPHFFGGVATVVCKLLMQAMPDVAIFGEKDYQQLLVIRQMVRDLDLPVVIVGAPTVREADGLAMSSRNAYLTSAERKLAPLLHRAISDAAIDVAGGRTAADACEAAVTRLTALGFEVDYLNVCDAETLVPITASVEAPARVLVAARLGKTRLIDNVAVI